jgi:hypothetical protein
MGRKEHLEWCKQRALEYVERGELPGAVASMCSDYGQHDDNGPMDPMLVMLGMMEIQNGAGAVRRWIEGFNW